MKAYKGFKKDLTCRGYQYKKGETKLIDGGKYKQDTWYKLNGENV